MTRKIGDSSSNNDEFEGDSIYISKEVLDCKRFEELTSKSDIFSLGLSFIELIFKIDLPKTGVIWNQLRNGDFVFTEEITSNANFKVPSQMIDMIILMINPNYLLRPSAYEVLFFLPELKKRLDLLLNNGNSYKNSYQKVFFM